MEYRNNIRIIILERFVAEVPDEIPELFLTMLRIIILRRKKTIILRMMMWRRRRRRRRRNPEYGQIIWESYVTARIIRG
jgi:hypothetical protein